MADNRPSKGPITALTVVDLENKKFARISKAEKGFIRSLQFEKALVIFEKEYHDTGKKSKLEVKLSEIVN